MAHGTAAGSIFKSKQEAAPQPAARSVGWWVERRAPLAQQHTV
jgi:hypothetical protein